MPIAKPDLYVPPLVRRAQIIRAILLARAVATTLKGRRARMAANHVEASVLCRACFKTDVAPRINKERSVELPIFDILPRRSLPPLECDLGVKPSQAAK